MLRGFTIKAWRLANSMAVAVQDPRSPPVVLLVDDEQPLLDAMRLGLASEFEVETAASAEEAALLLGTRRYDVLVCDQLLPGEQGLEFLIRVSERSGAPQRILLTGYINPELLSRSVSLAKLSACLLKPVHHAELIAAIHAALRG